MVLHCLTLISAMLSFTPDPSCCPNTLYIQFALAITKVSPEVIQQFQCMGCIWESSELLDLIRLVISERERERERERAEMLGAK